jgi:hypothetical protein
LSVEGVEAIRRILDERREVRLAYLFGSAVRGHARRSSDLDIAALFEAPPDPGEIDRLASQLEHAARQRVDLVILDTAPPLLAHEIIATGRVLVCRDERQRVSFEARTTARYLGTAHLRRVQHAYLRQRAEAYRARPS